MGEVERCLERLSTDQLLGAEERPILALGEIVDGDDARMVQASGEPGLTEEPLTCGGGAGVLQAPSASPRREELLQRHLPPDELIGRPPDHGLAAPSDLD